MSSWLSPLVLFHRLVAIAARPPHVWRRRAPSTGSRFVMKKTILLGASQSVILTKKLLLRGYGEATIS